MRVPSAWLTLAALLLAIACGTAAGAGCADVVSVIEPIEKWGACIYGNWCGITCYDKDGSGYPMLDADGYYDLLDLSCAMHASCYGRQGDCNLCQCDYALASRALEIIAAEHVGEACYASAGDASATQSARVAAAIKLYSGALYSLSACPETCKDGDSLDPNDETGCDSTWLFNTAFTGTAVSAYPNGYIAAAPAECCQLCTDDPECRAFTFDYLGSTCYMFLGDYQTSFESQAMVSGVWLGPTFEDPVATAAACPADNWEVMQDLDLVGGDLRRDAYVSTDTWEKCCAICALPNTACYGWTWSPKNQACGKDKPCCFLKKGTGSTPVNALGLVSGAWKNA